MRIGCLVFARLINVVIASEALCGWSSRCRLPESSVCAWPGKTPHPQAPPADAYPSERTAATARYAAAARTCDDLNQECDRPARHASGGRDLTDGCYLAVR